MNSKQITVHDIKAQLDLLPDDMVVSFMPISGAWLGTEFPMRFGEINYYKEGGEKSALPSDEGAYCQIYIYEDDSKHPVEIAEWEKEMVKEVDIGKPFEEWTIEDIEKLIPQFIQPK